MPLLSAPPNLIRHMYVSHPSPSSKFREMPSFKVREFYDKMTGGGSSSSVGGGGETAASEDDALNAELRELLRHLKLGAKLADMRAWCDEQGYDTIAEVIEGEESEDEFVKSLSMIFKPGKAKILLKRMKEMAKRAEPKPAMQQVVSGRI